MNPSKAQPTRKETVRTAVTKPAVKFWLLFSALLMASNLLIGLSVYDTLLNLTYYIIGSAITVMALGSK